MPTILWHCCTKSNHPWSIFPPNLTKRLCVQTLVTMEQESSGKKTLSRASLRSVKSEGDTNLSSSFHTEVSHVHQLLVWVCILFVLPPSVHQGALFSGEKMSQQGHQERGQWLVDSLIGCMDMILLCKCVSVAAIFICNLLWPLLVILQEMFYLQIKFVLLLKKLRN